MTIVADVLVGLVALIHVYIVVLEMVLWTKPIGIKTFGRPKQVMIDSASLAQNQGLYNLFLVAGLVWSLVALILASILGNPLLAERICLVGEPSQAHDAGEKERPKLDHRPSHE